MKEHSLIYSKIKSQVSPTKALEEKKQKFIDQVRTEYIKRVAMNHEQADKNLEQMQDLQRLEQALLERLQEHTMKQLKFQQEFHSLLGGSRPQTSAILNKQKLISQLAEKSQ